MLSALFALAPCGFVTIAAAEEQVLSDDNWFESIYFGSQHNTTGLHDASNALTDVVRFHFLFLIESHMYSKILSRFTILTSPFCFWNI